MEQLVLKLELFAGRDIQKVLKLKTTEGGKSNLKGFSKETLTALNDLSWIRFVDNDVYKTIPENQDPDFLTEICTKDEDLSDSLKVTLSLKNIKTLVVQIFEINPRGYILEQFKRVPSNIQLNGLVSVLQK